MRIQHNIAALNSYRNLGVNNSGVAKNLEKLSSGYRINRAGDDAAGLAISEKMRSQITGLNTATKNANDGISLVQTAEGALTEVHSMLNRMVEIATQSANGVYEDGVDRQALQDEMNALTSEINRIADGTNFNKKNLLDGTLDIRTKTVVNSGAKEKCGEAHFDVTFGKKVAGNALSIKLADGDGQAAEINAAGTEITLKFDVTGANLKYDAEAVQKAIRNIDVSKATNLTEEQRKDLQEAVSNAKVVATEEYAITGLDEGAGFDTTTAITGNPISANGEALNLQIGDTNDNFNRLEVAIMDLHADELNIDKMSTDEKTGISVETEDKAGKSIDRINEAINTVSTQRGKLGAIQNRLEHTINNLSVNAENMTAAESRIRDVDMADEMMKYTKNNILVQASQAMLAQANQVPQGVLQLLQ